MATPGIHIQRSVNNVNRRWVKVAPCVKQMDHTDALQLAQANAVRVYRKYYPNQSWTSNPYQQGTNIANDVIASLGGYNHDKLYLEGYNEPPQKMGADLEASLAFNRGFADVCRSRGYKSAGFSFATGTPEVNEAQYLAQNNFGGVSAVAFHGYWGSQGLTQWHALRYKMIRTAVGGRMPPVIITECGRDAVEGGVAGWKLSVTPEKYWQEIQSYHAQVSGDTLGYALFTGSPQSTWAQYDVDGFAALADGSGGYLDGSSGSNGDTGGDGGTGGSDVAIASWVAKHPLQAAALVFLGLVVLSD